jgi:catechol 2,3-dioxygenase-like lactoylglutathione lyase family enzyme
MKRFHVHVSVDDLEASIRFYSTIFGTAPAVEKVDYAKWMLEDPRINFAISRRGHATGINHLGIQVDSSEELIALRDQLESADAGMVEQSGTACCYAKSDKYWVTDPSGVAWETFHSLGTVPVFGEDSETVGKAKACCEPVKASVSDPCCVPITAISKSSCCAS